MFTSPRPVVFMLCGHSIHQACYYEHMKSSYKCPICSKSTVNMETQFRNLDRAIDGQPMPPQFQDTKAMVSCNDCYAKSAVKYHWLGLKCAICDSYNTAQLSILSDPAIEVPIIDTREPEHASPPNHPTREGVPSASVVSGPARIRRHSSYAQPSVDESNRASPYRLRSRLGRSVSPVRSRGDALLGGEAIDTAADDDDLDFWGRDESRSVNSAVLINNEMELDVEDEEDDDYYSDDSTSMIDDDCDDGDEEDRFALLGHR